MAGPPRSAAAALAGGLLLTLRATLLESLPERREPLRGGRGLLRELLGPVRADSHDAAVVIEHPPT